MTLPVGAEPARVFYGWWMALAFVVIAFLSTGLRARRVVRPVGGGR
jgi:hypothetical protein